MGCGRWPASPSGSRPSPAQTHTSVAWESDPEGNRARAQSAQWASSPPLFSVCFFPPLCPQNGRARDAVRARSRSGSSGPAEISGPCRRGVLQPASLGRASPCGVLLALAQPPPRRGRGTTARSPCDIGDMLQHDCHACPRSARVSSLPLCLRS